jgi:transposase
LLFPQFASVRVLSVEAGEGGVVFTVQSVESCVACPRCATVSSRTHGGYRRWLVDAPVAGRRVRVAVAVRRFRCVGDGCPAVTFAEQIPGLTSPFARFTPAAQWQLAQIALALAGRAGARVSTRLGLVVAKDTLIRLIRSLPVPAVDTVVELGVDDFALRKGHVYGTVLIDMATHKPVDVLADREAETLAAWLREHPGTAVVCRDRSGAYAQAVAAAAPEAIQVADRFHLWKNLCEAVGKTVTAHHGCLREAPPAVPEPLPVPEPEASPAAPVPQRRLVTRTRERFEAVHARLAAGSSLSAISRELNLDRQTVRRFAHAACVEDLLVQAENRPSILDGYTDVVGRLWNSGLYDAAQITTRIRELGYRGGARTVQRYLAAFRTPDTGRTRPGPARGAAPSTPPVPKPSKVSRWLLSNPEHLDQDEADQLEKLLPRCGHLENLRTHIRSFATIMTRLRGGEITAWIGAAEAGDLPHLASFASGLRRDLEAVINGLSLPYSSGAVEGNVNRIKTLKRGMYGRARFDLLRARVLLAH